MILLIGIILSIVELKRENENKLLFFNIAMIVISLFIFLYKEKIPSITSIIEIVKRYLNG